MKIDDLQDAFAALAFPEATAASTPPRDTILEARKLVASAVVDDEFLTECISLEIPRVRDSLGRGLPPFLVMPGTGIRLAFGYWAPGSTAGPHEHTAWTITTVCRNELDVRTFDRDESYRSKTFVPKHLFKAKAGSVGFIYEPCIHEPMNMSGEWSLSLHVSSPREGEENRDSDTLWHANREPRPLDEPHRRILEARHRHDFLDQLARTLGTLRNPGAKSVLAECLSTASSVTRRRFGPSLSQGGDTAREAPWRLARVHPDLALTDRHQDGMVSLEAHTCAGMVDGLVVSDVARHAIAFAAKAHLFEVQSLPGALSDFDRRTLAEALEETGFFVRVQT